MLEDQDSGPPVVKVRVAVALNPDGSWDSAGSSDWDEADALETLEKNNPGARMMYLTPAQVVSAPPPVEEVPAHVSLEPLKVATLTDEVVEGRLLRAIEEHPGQTSARYARLARTHADRIRTARRTLVARGVLVERRDKSRNAILLELAPASAEVSR